MAASATLSVLGRLWQSFGLTGRGMVFRSGPRQPRRHGEREPPLPRSGVVPLALAILRPAARRPESVRAVARWTAVPGGARRGVSEASPSWLDEG